VQDEPEVVLQRCEVRHVEVVAAERTSVADVEGWAVASSAIADRHAVSSSAVPLVHGLLGATLTTSGGWAAATTVTYAGQPVPWRKAKRLDVGDMVALVRQEPDEMWSVQWAREELEADPKGRSGTANGAKAYVESQMSMTTRIRWEQMGDDWVAYRRSR
jgi:hypothetical protein